MEPVTNYFQQQGILGIVIIMLIAVVLYQQRRIDAKDKQIDELQENRKQDGDKYTNAYVLTTREMVGTQQNSINTMNILQKSVDGLASAMQTIMNDRGKK